MSWNHWTIFLLTVRWYVVIGLLTELAVIAYIIHNRWHRWKFIMGRTPFSRKMTLAFSMAFVCWGWPVFWYWTVESLIREYRDDRR